MVNIKAYLHGRLHGIISSATRARGPLVNSYFFCSTAAAGVAVRLAL